MPAKGARTLDLRRASSAAVVGGLGFRSQRLNPGDLGPRVAVFLFLLEQSGVGLGTPQCVFGLLDLTRRGCALLLESEQSIKIALRGITGAAVFDELGVEREDFFACTAGIDVGLIGLRRFDLGLGASGLAAQVGIIELQQQLTLANVVTFFHEQMFHGSGGRGVRFEVADGFDFSVGGDQAADRSASDCGGANPQGPGTREDRDESQRNGDGSETQPRAAFARGTSVRIVVGSCQLVIF